MPTSLNLTPATWQLWCFAAIALALAIALESDLLEGRISNLLVVLLLVVGVALQAAGPANERAGMFDAFPGALGGGKALLGAATGLVLFLPMYLAGAMGAGDVKFMAALGAFAGPTDVVGLALSIAVCGGALSLVLTVARRKMAVAWGNVVRLVRGLTHPQGSEPSFDPATQTALRMPYALAFAFGVACYGSWRQSGHPALLGF